jgi:hypothetical protein
MMLSLTTVFAAYQVDSSPDIAQDMAGWDYGGGHDPNQMKDSNDASYSISSSASYARAMFKYKAPTNAVDFIASLLMINGTWTNYSSPAGVPDDRWVWLDIRYTSR